LGEGRQPRENLGAWKALFEHLGDEFKIGRAYKKALRS
jgi:hypothetical protein